MTIRFICSCGQTLSAKDENVGREYHCPKCRTLLRVPQPVRNAYPPAQLAAPPSQPVTDASNKTTSLPLSSSPPSESTQPDSFPSKGLAKFWSRIAGGVIVLLLMGILQSQKPDRRTAMPTPNQPPKQPSQSADSHYQPRLGSKLQSKPWPITFGTFPTSSANSTSDTAPSSSNTNDIADEHAHAADSIVAREENIAGSNGSFHHNSNNIPPASTQTERPVAASTISIDITASPQADERLFLLRLLESLYGQFAVAFSDPQGSALLVSELRGQALRYRAHAASSGIDSEVVQLFDDFVSAIDSYVQALTNISTIGQESNIVGTREAFESGFAAGTTGTVAYHQAKANEYSTKQALGAALALGSAELLFDMWQKGAARDAATKQAYAAQLQRFRDQWMTALARAQSTSLLLSDRYAWHRGEAGFDLSNAYQARVTRLLENDDLEGIQRLLEEQVKGRPRDPFIRVCRNLFASLSDSLSAQQLLSIAGDTVATTSLIPASPVYDEYRLSSLVIAGWIANDARDEERLRGGNAMESSEAGPFAVAVWRKALEYARTDPSGEVRRGLMQALLGISAFNDAYALGREIKGSLDNDYDFAYAYACVLANVDRYDDAIIELRRAVSSGGADIAGIRRDPYLANLRTAKTDAVSGIIDVKYNWQIDYDLLFHDIVLTNRSLFPLTGVVFRCDIEESGKRMSYELKADFIGPGESHTWADVISVPRKSIANPTSKLVCNENI